MTAREGARPAHLFEEGARPAHLFEEGARPAHRGGGTPPLPYRPRRLPHLDAPGYVQAITFRLADSLPREAIDRLAASGEAGKRARAAALLDAGHGRCLLADPRNAGLVEAALLHFDGTRYRLHAWVVMPNHVHVLVGQRAGHPLRAVVHGWKSWTAHRIGGRLWAREFFDRAIRDEEHYRSAVAYVPDNPVKAGLVARAEDWRFGSAWRWATGARSAHLVEEGARPAHPGGETPPLQEA